MKNNIVFVILCIIYSLALFLNQKVIWSFYLVFLILILASRQRLVYKPVVIIFTLLLPLLWTILLSAKYTIYSNVQGLFYLSIPFIMFIIGYQISRLLSLKQFLIYVVYLGTILSLIYISIIISKVGFIAFLSPYEEARFVVGSGSPASILSLIITLYSERYGFKIYKNNIDRYVFIIVNILAIYLFASRTYWVVLFIFLFMFNLKRILKSQVVIFLLLCAGIFLLIIFPVKLTGDIVTTKSLVFKIVKTFSEIKFSDYTTYSDINTHYRGYEAYRAFMTYLDGSPINILFGHGLGKAIDLKASVYLAGVYRSVIPWIHNGYFFILVKEGAMGLLGLLLFFFQAFKIGYRNLEGEDTENRFMSLMIISCVFSLILTNYVISSMFTIEMAIIMIMIGALIQILYVKNNESKLITV